MSNHVTLAAKTCEHAEFLCEVRVVRLTDTDDGPVIGYRADARIRCAECGESFTWLGLPGGLHPTLPTVSLDGHELRAPIAPESHRQAPIDFLDEA